MRRYSAVAAYFSLRGLPPSAAIYPAPVVDRRHSALWAALPGSPPPSRFMEAAGPADLGIGAVLQAGYAWGMCFGLASLFHIMARRERSWITISVRRVWPYLRHLPLDDMGPEADARLAHQRASEIPPDLYVRDSRAARPVSPACALYASGHAPAWQAAPLPGSPSSLDPAYGRIQAVKVRMPCLAPRCRRRSGPSS